MGGAVFLYLLYDSTTTTPPGEAAATLRGPCLLMGHQGLTDLLIELHPSLLWGRYQTILPGYNLGLGTPRYHTEYPGDSATVTGPLEKDQTFTQDHCFNKTTSITPMVL